VIDSKGTLTILVKAEGVWVYQFSDTVQQDFKTQIQNKSEQDAINYLKAQPGVKDVKIEISNGGTTLSDAANITIEIVPIPGTTGTPTTGTPTTGTPTTGTPTTGTPTPHGSPTIVPTGAVTPPVTPTPTQGLGGS
jgi:hypothetical protein